MSTNLNGTARTLSALTFTADQTAAVTITTVVGTPVTFQNGAVIKIAGGNHAFVGTGSGSSATSRDLAFVNTGSASFSFDIAGGSSFDIQGRVGGSAASSSFTKTGEGTLILAANSGGSGAWQHGGFTIQQGVVLLAETNAGGNSANNFTVSNGAALELSGGFNQTASNGNYTLNGTGIGSGGALRSISGNNTITAVNSATGTIALNTASSIGVDADTLTIKKVVSGSGSLTKVGAGTLVLSGTYSDNSTTFSNTYTGNTIISAGTLEVQGSIASSSGITNNAALVFNSSAAQSYGNAIGGSGTLTKQGGGTLTLSANNAYTGDTTISAGILQIGNGGTTGSLGNHSHTFIASGAELRIDRSTDGFGYSYTGELSGSGTVNILASRRFNFQTNNQNASGSLSFVVDGVLGINTPSGVTAVHLGELSGSGVIQRAGAAPSNPPLTILTIGDKNTSSTYSGNISTIAEFAIEKVGSGTLTLEGSYGHGGGTTVSAGTLLVNGSLGNSAVTVDPLAALGGTGSIGGSLSFAATSQLQVVDFNDPLAVTGTITFDSGFGIANLLGIDWDSLGLNTPYTVISTSQTFGTGDLAHFGLANAVAVGTSGRQAYFTNGSLAVVVIPEPATGLLAGLGMGLLLRRCRN